MAEWVEVAQLKELTRRKKKLVEVGDEPIALFFVDGEVYALHDICIHQQRNLHKGTLFKGKVICPGHQWAFDPATGWVADQEQCTKTYAVKVEGDTVYVDPEPRILKEPGP